MAYRPPMISATDAAVIERAYRLANKAMFTVALQVRRLDSLEPEDENFVFRKHADWEFLIVSLYRLQRAAQIVTATERGVTEVIPALVQFRKQVPGQKTMRDVGEHFDDYALDQSSTQGPISEIPSGTSESQSPRTPRCSRSWRRAHPRVDRSKESHPWRPTVTSRDSRQATSGTPARPSFRADLYLRRG